jgi:hypothetical protein
MRAVILILGCVCLWLGGFCFGEKHRQKEIENRAKEIKTETITRQQLEIIIFNEIQL